MSEDPRFSIVVDFEKSAAGSTGKFVRGWASVVSEGGKPVEDYEGDVISIDEIRKAAHGFVTSARVAKAMHAGKQAGEVVESVIIDDAFAKAMGITDPRRGWWIGMRIDSPDIQKQVRDGVLKCFSIGGKGRRREIKDGTK